MTLKEQITEDMKNAMRAKDSERLGTIRLLLAAIKQKEVDERVVVDDVMVVAIVDKLIKQRKDSIEAFEKAERKDLADKEKSELLVLQAYLPARMSADEVTTQVKSIVAALAAELGRAVGPGDMGKVMGAVKAQLAGKADMGQVSAAVKAALAPCRRRHALKVKRPLGCFFLRAFLTAQLTPNISAQPSTVSAAPHQAPSAGRRP